MKNNVFYGIIISFVGILAIYLTYIVYTYRGLSFDGAFNTQAALNIFEGNGCTLNYGLNRYLQTGLPFQLLNGLFLTTFGSHFSIANLANIVFYWLLFAFSVALMRRYRSSSPMLAFIAISFLQGFYTYGFAGYGEVPGIILALWAGYLIFERQDLGFSSAACGGILLGLAVGIKWILLLPTIAALGVTILILYRQKGIRLLSAWLFFFVSLATSLFLQYTKYTLAERSSLLRRILQQGGGGTDSLKAGDSFERLKLFYNAYVNASGAHFPIVAWVKLFAVSVIICIVIGLTLYLFIKRTKPVERRTYFFLYIGWSVCFYFVWWFFLGMKPWYRRIIAGDILLYTAIPFLVMMTPRFKGRWWRSAVFTLLLFFALFQVKSSEIFPVRKETQRVRERRLRDVLAQLPVDFYGYGVGWWQAPRWSFLAGKRFSNLETVDITDSPEFYVQCKQGKAFFFRGPEDSLAPGQVNNFMSGFNMTPVFQDKKFGVYRIDINPFPIKPVEHIDFSVKGYQESLMGFHKYEKSSFRHTERDALLFFKNSGRNIFNLQATVSGPLAGQTLTLTFFDDRFQPFLTQNIILEAGEQQYEVYVPDSMSETITVRIKTEDGWHPAKDPRLLGIMVYSAGFPKDI